METVEKNWFTFVYDDIIHIVYTLNPLVVVRVPDNSGADEEIRTELVSRAAEAVYWRYGEIRGGTPAVFDADLGGYILFFHSVLHPDLKTERGPQRIKLYFMGCLVFSAHPPFTIQLISERPLVGPSFYDEHWSREKMRVIFPAGLLVTPEAYVVSYGKDDNSTRIVRFDRRQLQESLQPPRPHTWSGPEC